MRKFFLLLMVLFPALAWGQGSCVLFPAQLTTGAALTDASSYVCLKGTATNACLSGTNAVPVFSDETLASNFALTQPVQADSTGNTYICVAPGTYTVCTTSPRANPYCWNQQFYAALTQSAAIAVAPSSISFGSVQTGTSSPAQNVTIINTGTSTIAITSAVLSGNADFSSSNITACNGVLGASQTCTIPFQFNPTSAVAESATVTVTSSVAVDPSKPLVVTLTGTGAAASSVAVTAACSGNGVGSITSGESPALISASCSAGVCSGTCSNSYASGSSVTLTGQVGGDGSTFAGFSGGGCSTSPCTFTASGATTVTGTFNPPTTNFQLSFLATGQGGGTMTTNVADTAGQTLNCTAVAGVISGTCNGLFPAGTSIQITATPNGSSTFAGFSGLTSSSTSPVTITLNGSGTVSANFTPSSVPPALVQTATGALTTTTSKGATWGSAQKAGDAIICATGYGSNTITVSSVTDTKGNTYTQLAANSPKTTTGLTQAVYIASNIVAAAAGANTTTFAYSASVINEVRCLEYAGIATATPVDVSSAAVGSGTALAAGSAITTQNNDSLIGFSAVASSITGADTTHGYKQESIVGGDDAEDQIGVATGTYNFQPTQQFAQPWIATLVALKGQSTSGSGTSFSLTITGNTINPGTGTVTSNAGSPPLNCTISAGVPSGTCSTLVPQNSSITLTATAAAGSIFQNYNGITGCGTNPTCVVPTITSNMTALVAFILPAPTTFTLSSQQPITLVPYAGNANSITTKQLPADVMSHLYAGASGIGPSDAVAKCLLTDCGGTTDFTTLGGMAFVAGPTSSDTGYAFYYASAADPWYKISGCTASFLNGLVFHAPSGAKFSQGATDESLMVWDQSSDLLLQFATGSGGQHALPASGCAGSGSSSCAVATNSLGYCAVEQFHNERDWGYTGIAAPLGGGNSVATGKGTSAFAGITRYQEIMQGAINHAVFLLDDCHNTTVSGVFPETTGDNGLLCNVSFSGPNSVNRPAAGMLFFLDYTDAQINSMGLPAWQKPIITAFAHYGGYVGVTSGQVSLGTNNTLGVSIGGNNVESPEAYNYQGVTNTFLPWLIPQAGVTKQGTTDVRYGVHIFAGIPLETCSGTGCGTDTSGRVCSTTACDVTGHAHIADPCIVKGYAGVSGGCF